MVAPVRANLMGAALCAKGRSDAQLPGRPQPLGGQGNVEDAMPNGLLRMIWSAEMPPGQDIGERRIHPAGA
jgi:hypothetical protein